MNEATRRYKMYRRFKRGRKCVWPRSLLSPAHFIQNRRLKFEDSRPLGLAKHNLYESTHKQEQTDAASLTLICVGVGVCVVLGDTRYCAL